MFVLRTSTAEETKAVASAVADLARPGDVVVLSGDLGAGKTTFTQGFARALGVTDPVTSPTFVLHRSYAGRLLLHHLDVYRLAGPDEAEDLDLAELLEGDAVTLVEWGETIAAVLPAERVTVRLSLGAGDDDRVLRLEWAGGSWAARAAALGTALASWGGPPAEGADPDRAGSDPDHAGRERSETAARC
jgi:tRNA threonylcarbamoyladenosine biosynthesis protein TsaE